MEGMRAFCLQRASIFKIVYSEQKHEWLDFTTPILHATDPLTGAASPVQTTDSTGSAEFISEDQAAWVDEVDPATGGPKINPATGEPVRSLSTDPSVVWDSGIHSFVAPPNGVLRTHVSYRGAKAVLIDSDSFLCPSTAASVDAADFVAELYDKSLSYVDGIVLDRPWLPKDLAMSRIKAHATAEPKTDVARNNDSEETFEFDEKASSVQLVECWVRRDVLGWGRPQDFMVLIQPDTKTAVYYEYQANVCPDFSRPYVTISATRHKGYWWGKSIPELLKQFQDYIDKQFNRHSARNEINANPIGGFNRSAVKEKPDALKLEIGGMFELENGKSIHDFVQWATMPNADMDTQKLIDFCVYMVQKWLAISDLAQGDYSDLPENSTKYGIQATQKEGNKNNRRFGRRLIQGFERIGDKMVKLQRDQLDAEEVFEFSDGDQTVTASATPDGIRQYEYNVTLEIGQHLTDDDVNASQQALQAQQQYFAILDPIQRAAARPLIAKILERIGFKDTDRLLPDPLMMPPPMVGPDGRPLAPEGIPQQPVAAGQ